MELVADPTILVLDEPTTGLDSTASYALIESMKAVAGMGLTVITVIHQPRFEVFTQFDDVLLLGHGGRVVYTGTADGVLDYFASIGYHCPERVNPADYLMDVISGLARPNHEQSEPVSLATAAAGVDESLRDALTRDWAEREARAADG